MSVTQASLYRRARGLLHGALTSLAFLPGIATLPAHAVVSGAAMGDFAAVPVTTVESVTPLVMLTMSRDHQYFFRAYNDYTDLDPENGDGIETTYDNTFEYYGYFDPKKCYTYSDANGRFEPQAFMTTLYYCNDVAGDWSGNFLNWATMTRMDIVRKLLYGGKRAIDTPTLTVLERAMLPHDAHSFAKYYNGDDLPRLTPFTVITDGNGGDGDGFDDRNEGITICNTTRNDSGAVSQNVTDPPLMRVVRENRQLWGANERWQCTWEDEGGGDDRNSNDFDASGIDAADSDPPDTLALRTAGGNRDRIVRVEACNPALIEKATNFENCRQYPDGNFKPTGLLQRYGESEQLLFGLITGSYEQNISGGMLRKNIGNIADEVNQATDGTFRHLTAPLASGIIQTLDTLRAYGYQYRESGGARGSYNGGGGDGCDFQMDRLEEGTCTFWGNPISEIYYETLRYFARAGSAAFATPDDTGRFPNLRTAPWPSSGDHPLQEDNRCAQLNAIVFNASVSSYDAPNQGGDGDDYPATGALQGLTGGSISINAYTEQVGAGEGINGGQYFIGKVLGSTPAGADDFEYCTAKTVDSLANAVGLCPEGPTVDGSYNMAGLAYYARTNDLIPDTTSGLEGVQDVRTFAISLATTTPVIEIPNGPNGSPTAATILPAYRLIFNNGGGALVDFKIVQPHTEIDPADFGSSDPIKPEDPGSGYYYGRYYVNWEDSEQGGDYDQDMFGVIDYLLDTAAGTITVRTNAVAASTRNGQLFGFTISGTTQDGFHAYSGIFGADYTDPDPSIPGCNDCRAIRQGGRLQTTGQVGPEEHTFTLTDATAGVLESPLFYAAKWGGFNDINGNDIPDDPLEWDTKDTSGNEIIGGDGIPDNYFFVTNPAALEDALTTVFDAILERVASGTAASVVANEQKGTGAVFQALYDPVVTDTADNEVTWIGTLQGIFVDAAGFLREDGDSDAILDDYNTDPVIDIFFDDTLDEPRARLRRYTSSEAAEFVESGFTDTELTALDSLWNAREALSALSDVTTHRGARSNLNAVNTTSAGTGRQIWTWLDADFDGVVDSGEQVPFDSVEFDHTNAGWLDLEGNLALNPDADTDVDNLVNYIRGEQVAGLRNRVVDYDGDGTVETIRLGDIVHSTPTPAAVPAEAYDLLALDLSYFEFRDQYRNRRQVVYIGANDGMIHAFNGGFFEEINDAGEVKFGFTQDGPDGATSHPLGAELWAYVPRALLPQLKWLARNDYSHVYYMDLKPRLFDARIFPDDSDHPDGWGTVLVVGMRFGGGNDTNGIIVDAESDGRGSSNSDDDEADDVQTKSAYVILDVTNPEKPPKLIAEVSPPGLNLTTSFPAVAVFGTPTESGTAPATNDWYLVFGNGPESVGDAVSSTNARLYAYDLEDLVDGGDGLVTAGFFDPTGDPVGAGFDLGEPESFVSDPVVRDDDLDMRAEVLYFGTVGDLDSNTGKVFRVPLGEQADAGSWADPHVLLDAGQPFVGQLSVTVDQFFEPWVIGGTGRLYVTQDKANSEQQSLYGFIDPNERTSLTDRNEAPIGDFVDVTGYRVFDDGSVSTDGDTTGDTTFTDVANDVRAAGGWVRNFDNPGTIPSQRTINRSPLVNGVLFSTAFTPADDICGNDGEGELIALDFLTGTPRPAPVLGGVDVVVPCPGCPDSTVTESLPSVSLGVGVPSPASIHVDGRGAGRVGTGTSGDITVIVQKSTGAIQTDDATVGAGPNPGEMSWREYRDF